MTYVLTVIAGRDAEPLPPALLERLRAAVSGRAIDTLAPGQAADIACAAAPDMAAARAALRGAPVDLIAQLREGRRKRLLIADMDSTIVAGETLDDLASEAGVGAQVAAITRRSNNGEIEFAQALRERVTLLRGLKLAALARTWAATRLAPGACALVATMRAHGAVTALVSGGFSYFTARVAALACFDRHHGNVLLDDGARLTGEVAEPILDRDAKRRALLALAAEHGLGLGDTLAVGDGANDLAMLGAAGLGIAYRAAPIVAGAARARVDHADLRALLFAQGYRAEEILDPIPPAGA